MNETLVTVQGYVGTDPEERAVGDAVVASFRIGSTPRRFNREQNSWVDLETNWYTVNAWRTLGKHVLASVRMREPVIVHGRLRTNVWKDEQGLTHSTLVIEALSVGHDLCRGTSVFLKSNPGSGSTVDDAELRALNAQLGAATGQITSDGEVIESETAA
jgi:single-strand DNA-binding protein